MIIHIEFWPYGINHFQRIDEYSYELGTMVRGFSFRIKPLFVWVVVSYT